MPAYSANQHKSGRPKRRPRYLPQIEICARCYVREAIAGARWCDRCATEHRQQIEAHETAIQREAAENSQ